MKINDPRLRLLEAEAYDEHGKLKTGWNVQVSTDEDGETDVILYDEYALAMEERKKEGRPHLTREEYEVERELEEEYEVERALEEFRWKVKHGLA